MGAFYLFEVKMLTYVQEEITATYKKNQIY